MWCIESHSYLDPLPRAQSTGKCTSGLVAQYRQPFEPRMFYLGTRLPRLTCWRKLHAAEYCSCELPVQREKLTKKQWQKVGKHYNPLFSGYGTENLRRLSQELVYILWFLFEIHHLRLRLGYSVVFDHISLISIKDFFHYKKFFFIPQTTRADASRGKAGGQWPANTLEDVFVRGHFSRTLFSHVTFIL